MVQYAWPMLETGNSPPHLDPHPARPARPHYSCCSRQVLAMHLKNEKRTKEAVAVMKRIRAMEEELAGVPQEEEEDGEA